jgi:hypothetical protein
LDHYLIFNKLEQYLQTPTRLKEQLVFQITDEMADRLIEKLNEFDFFFLFFANYVII